MTNQIVQLYDVHQIMYFHIQVKRTIFTQKSNLTAISLFYNTAADLYFLMQASAPTAININLRITRFSFE